MSTKDVDKGRKKIIKNVAEFKKRKVKIGFWGGMKPEGSGANFATIMFFNELGTEYIPPRPAMKQSVEKNKDEIVKMAKDGMNEIYEGKATGRQVLAEIELKARGHLVKELRSGDFEANAAATIAQKRGSKPLFADGHLSMAVMSEVD